MTTFDQNYLSGTDLQFWLGTKDFNNLILDNLIFLPELILGLYNKKIEIPLNLKCFHLIWNEIKIYVIVFLSSDNCMEVFVKGRNERAMTCGYLREFVIMNVKGTISRVHFAWLYSIDHDV
jgi:hypothetical protein